MIAGRKVLALITARGGSKGVPGKNLLPIGGKPLLQWTIDAARASNFIDRLVLSSDDKAICQAAAAGGCDVPFVRPAHLATDEAASIDVVLDAIERVPGYDLIVLLQPTSPLRTGEDIDAALQALVDADAPACVSVREAVDHPMWTYGLDARGRLQPFVDTTAMPRRRQDLPPAWCLNGAVYVARREWLQVNRSFLGPDTVAAPMPAERSIDIDTPADVEQLRRLVADSAFNPHSTPRGAS